MQLKNRKNKESPHRLLSDEISPVGREERTSDQEPPRKRVRTESGQKFLFNHANAKLLYIIPDLGVDEPGVEFSYSKSEEPNVWVIHSTDHDEDVFGRINK